MHRFIIALIVVTAVAASGHRASAQTLTVSLLERYLESLREQAGIPGMSALILQDERVIWARGFGRADVEGLVLATADTPYAIGGLSQVIGATLVLKACVESGLVAPHAPLADLVPGWILEPATTMRDLLAHVAPSGAFNYDLTRFAALTPLIEECARRPYRQLLDEEILTRLGLLRTVPGTAMAAPPAEDVEVFGQASLDRYRQLVGEIAKPYRIDSRGRVTPTELGPSHVNAATGLVTTVHDLARFDASLTLRSDGLLEPPTLLAAWSPAAPHLPAGLGWFVQAYQHDLVVWQFGQVKDAYSALLVKVPTRGLTFILLANSDALAAPFAGRDTWDVNASLFARVFLRIFVP